MDSRRCWKDSTAHLKGVLFDLDPLTRQATEKLWTHCHLLKPVWDYFCFVTLFISGLNYEYTLGLILFKKNLFLYVQHCFFY